MSSLSMNQTASIPCWSFQWSITSFQLRHSKLLFSHIDNFVWVFVCWKKKLCIVKMNHPQHLASLESVFIVIFNPTLKEWLTTLINSVYVFIFGSSGLRFTISGKKNIHYKHIFTKTYDQDYLKRKIFTSICKVHSDKLATIGLLTFILW